MTKAIKTIGKMSTALVVVSSLAACSGESDQAAVQLSAGEAAVVPEIAPETVPVSSDVVASRAKPILDNPNLEFIV